MPPVTPFPGLRPDPAHAAEVIAPPYDVVSRDEARRIAAGPNNFLHVSRPEIDLPDTVAWNDPRVYAKGAENFQRMLADGVLRRDSAPSFYIYRLATPRHVQTGLVATVSVADYLAHRVRRHEHTRPDKEDDRTRHMRALGAQTGPVLCVHRDSEAAADLLRRITERQEPDHTGLEVGGAEHSLWVVPDARHITDIQSIYGQMRAFYIADGHHRSAAAARVAAEHSGSASHPSQYFLVVLFAESEVRILDYNRIVTDLNGMQPAEFLQRLQAQFEVARVELPVAPRQRGEFGMYLNGGWYRLIAREPAARSPDPVDRLDVSLLSHSIIEPLLGITDPRIDPRIGFVGGIRGLDELRRRVDATAGGVAFSLCPTPLEDLMAVADANEVMPPKSTWFEPKLADGLISHMLDD